MVLNGIQAAIDFETTVSVTCIHKNTTHTHKHQFNTQIEWISCRIQIEWIEFVSLNWRKCLLSGIRSSNSITILMGIIMKSSFYFKIQTHLDRMLTFNGNRFAIRLLSISFREYQMNFATEFIACRCSSEWWDNIDSKDCSTILNN